MPPGVRLSGLSSWAQTRPTGSQAHLVTRRDPVTASQMPSLPLSSALSERELWAEARSLPPLLALLSFPSSDGSRLPYELARSGAGVGTPWRGAWSMELGIGHRRPPDKQAKDTSSHPFSGLSLHHRGGLSESVLCRVPTCPQKPTKTLPATSLHCTHSGPWTGSRATVPLSALQSCPVASSSLKRLGGCSQILPATSTRVDDTPRGPLPSLARTTSPGDGDCPRSFSRRGTGSREVQDVTRV